MAAARRPVFYVELGVPDTPEGRFELLALHLWLTLRPLKRGAGAAGASGRPGQSLLETYFAELDAALRESGVGDMGVPHRMRRLAKTFYSRLEVLDSALEDKEAMARLLTETLYAGRKPAAAASARMVEYLHAAAGAMAKPSGGGGLAFPDP